MSASGLEEISLAELLRLALDNRQIDLHVAMPAKVSSYSSSAQTVTVQPMLYRHIPDGDGNFIAEALPSLADVPVAFPRCQQFGVTFPLVAGDYGLLVFSERNIGAWRTTGNAGDPGDTGMHTLDGAVFIPGLYPDALPASSASGSNMVIGSDTNANSRIVITPSSGVQLGSGATDGVMTATDAKALYTAISNAIPAAGDGGASLQSTLLSNLFLSGWGPQGGVTQLASSKIKAVR